MLIDNPKYSWLKELGLESVNKGAYWGQWGGSGPVSSIASDVIVGCSFNFVLLGNGFRFARNERANCKSYTGKKFSKNRNLK